MEELLKSSKQSEYIYTTTIKKLRHNITSCTIYPILNPNIHPAPAEIFLSSLCANLTLNEKLVVAPSTTEKIDFKLFS